jgi:hypothetical protein
MARNDEPFPMRGRPSRILALTVCAGAVLADADCSLLAPSDAELRGPTIYHDMTSAAFWSTFDASSVFAGATDFAGAAFDGRYVYLAPSAGGVVTRYDTTGDFEGPMSWSIFDTSTLPSGGAQAFAGAVFDGRFLYLVPSGGGLVVRYDSQASFDDVSSWSEFDTTTVNAGAEDYVGGTFDGRYVYFAPYHNHADSDGIVAQVDTMGDFEAASSWATFDVAPISPDAVATGFRGAVFDGQYVYLVQNQNGGAPSGLVARHDTQASLTTPGSWSFFDVQTVNQGATAFFGAAFDGRYLYAVPSHPGPPSILARYDTQGGDFAASWSTFDTTLLGAAVSGFAGAAFDGRYVYLVPNDNGSPDGLVARLDTTAGDFTATAAWSTFDTSTLSPSAAGFTGSVFDGRFLYLAPSSGGVVARFDARTPPSLPALPAFHGSFL